eukprot:SAG11_NODE_51_length_19848_cov_37.780698_11_plen_215_part_00
MSEPYGAISAQEQPGAAGACGCTGAGPEEARQEDWRSEPVPTPLLALRRSPPAHCGPMLCRFPLAHVVVCWDAHSYHSSSKKGFRCVSQGARKNAPRVSQPWLDLIDNLAGLKVCPADWASENALLSCARGGLFEPWSTREMSSNPSCRRRRRRREHSASKTCRSLQILSRTRQTIASVCSLVYRCDTTKLIMITIECWCNQRVTKLRVYAGSC